MVIIRAVSHCHSKFLKDKSLNLSIISKVIFILLISLQLTINRSTLIYSADWYRDFIYWFSLITIIFSVLTKKFTRIEVMIYTFILFFLFIHSLFNNFRLELFHITACALVIKDQSKEWIAKNVFFTYIVILLTIILLASLNTLPTVLILRDDGTLRDSLGFVHPNISSGTFLAIFYLFLLHNNKVKIPGTTLLGFLSSFLILNHFWDSSTPFYLLLLLLGYNLILRLFSHKAKKHQSRFEKIVISFMNVLPVIALLISFFGSYFYDENVLFLRQLNSLLTGRLVLGRTFVHDYPVTLFGVEVVQMATSEIWRILDNGYLNILLRFGVLNLILLLFILVKVGRKLYDLGYIYAPIIVLSLLIYGMIEPTFMSLPFNIILLFGGVIFSEQSSSNQVKEDDN